MGNLIFLWTKHKTNLKIKDFSHTQIYAYDSQSIALYIRHHKMSSNIFSIRIKIVILYLVCYFLVCTYTCTTIHLLIFVSTHSIWDACYSYSMLETLVPNLRVYIYIILWAVNLFMRNSLSMWIVIAEADIYAHSFNIIQDLPLYRYIYIHTKCKYAFKP